MRIFVTGATGFVGSHFTGQALAKGWEVVAHRRSPESRPRVPLSREPRWITCPLDEIPADALEGCCTLVHLAAHTPNPPYDSFDLCFYWNVSAVVRLFDLAAARGLKRWVVAGSAFEYGRAAERYERIPPTAPLEPVASYPASKAAASVALTALAIHHDAALWLGRIFQVFGPGEPETRLWPSLKKAAEAGQDFPMTAGEQVRDFIPVEGVAAQFIRAVEREDIPPGRPVVENVGTGRAQTLREFAMHWWSAWGASGRLCLGEVPYRPNEVMRYVPEVPAGLHSERLRRDLHGL
jgi:nucleoside-diphosphate-sugar epimerase